MPRSNPKRRARTFERNFGERAAAVRAMGCLVHNRWFTLPDVAARAMTPERWARCGWAIEACHVRARGMGGAKGDRMELVPLCSVHHREAGEFRTSQRAAFQERYAIDLTAEGKRIADRLDADGYA